MGRATKWFRNLLGLKKPDPNLTPSPASNRDKRRWSFVKSLREKHDIAVPKNNPNSCPYALQPIDVSDAVDDPEKQAIAIAAATAAVAEAAVAAAQAASAAVRLTSSGRCPPQPTANFGARQQWAAVKIQSTFRGYLARRALRALRGLVRLQALVRGHIERKRTAQWMRSMHALFRAQARARAGRSQISESSQSSSKSNHFHHPGPQTPEKLEHPVRSRSAKFEQPSNLKRNGSKLNGRSLADHDRLCSGWNSSERVPSTRMNVVEHERDDKIVEVDTGKPFTARRRNLFHSTHLALTPEQFISSFTNSKDSHQTASNPSSPEMQSLKMAHEIEEPLCTAVNSPQFCSASSKGATSRRSPFTPARSDCSRSFLSGYSEYFPSYMSYTESSKAKLRSISAPKQRTQYERSSSTKRSVNKSSLYTSFASKAYPGSGRLDSFGMPVGRGF